LASSPAREGLDLDRILEGDIRDSPSARSLTQTSLVFGLLHAIFKVKLRRQILGKSTKLDENSSQGTAFDLHHFAGPVQHRKTLPKYTADYVQQRNSRVAVWFEFAQKGWESLARLEERHRYPYPIAFYVTFAIQLLATMVQVTASQLRENCGFVSHLGCVLFATCPIGTKSVLRQLRSPFIQ
jgi:hypothetical protein